MRRLIYALSGGFGEHGTRAFLSREHGLKMKGVGNKDIFGEIKKNLLGNRGKLGNKVIYFRGTREKHTSVRKAHQLNM